MASKVVVVLVMLYLSGFTCGIRLDENGYTDILIAINPAVTEDPLLLERIKETVSDASSYLFQVMNNKLYFKDVTILVPPKWTGKYSRANTETYEKANIIIDEPNKFNGNDPYTIHYGECGTEGRYISLTPDFLKLDQLIKFYGPRGRVLVHEWAHLRWGVYDEYDERKPFYTADGKLEATSGAMCTPTNINGKPSNCYFFPLKSQTAKTSIMYLQSIDSVESPSGQIYNTFKPDPQGKSLTLNIPGTAEQGTWTYTITSNGQPQTMSITVTSRAVSADVPPVTVKTHMNQQSSNGAKAMVVFAAVSQNGLPVILANVRATLESDTGDKKEMDLLDNGAGADAFRNDGIYSRYFTRMKGGKYNLKVRAENGYGKARFSLKKHSGAMYIPGYVVDGKLELNPPKPSVGEEDLEADVGIFSRTAVGESFTVNLTPGVPATKFPPNTITDLNAELVKDRVLLTWTAPGEDLDQGTASEYEIRYSEDPDVLRSHFSNAHLINSSNLLPSESGSSEQLSFTPNHGTMGNGTTLFFAVKAVDKDMLSSETSNLAQVSARLKFPPNKITDLNAELVKDKVLLTWTAPGEDFDQGTASEYEIRYSKDPDVLRSHFSNAHLINSSNLLPSESGSSEQLSFTPTHGTMGNGTTLFFAVKAVDKDMLSSETSNLAQITKVIGYIESPGTGVKMIAIYISIAVVAIAVGLIVGVTMTSLNQKRTLQINQGCKLVTFRRNSVCLIQYRSFV
ncbi:calcium-activated chloride channel regulator 4-like [Hypomesus transpacificus]|uniref:calcium-activated chloride channel regulator 4-like n=1 Tax=Hypomesus transpacificus TaxID=137520 RepID=UPI001F07BA95|nr:calcium-activated chloride channel regulator 4-like [Hypomesus transpacificus]